MFSLRNGVGINHKEFFRLSAQDSIQDGQYDAERQLDGDEIGLEQVGGEIRFL